MIVRYRVLAERLRAEVLTLDLVVAQAIGAVARAAQQPQDQDYFIAAAALELHGFYAGVERLLEVIVGEVDGGQPTGRRWYRDLLTQMSLAVPNLRPAVLSSDISTALIAYLDFRHVVRNVYTFNLRPERVVELVRDVRATFDLATHDLLAFATFLDGIAMSDEKRERRDTGD
jgi:HepT-like protein